MLLKLLLMKNDPPRESNYAKRSSSESVIRCVRKGRDSFERQSIYDSYHTVLGGFSRSSSVIPKTRRLLTRQGAAECRGTDASAKVGLWLATDV